MKTSTLSAVAMILLVIIGATIGTVIGRMAANERSRVNIIIDGEVDRVKHSLATNECANTLIGSGNSCKPMACFWQSKDAQTGKVYDVHVVDCALPIHEPAWAEHPNMIIIWPTLPDAHGSEGQGDTQQ